MTLTGILFVGFVVLGLYVFSIFSTPHLRFTFYLLPVLMVLTIGIGLMNRPFEGSHQTARTP